MALPLPISHVIIDGKEVELFRCDSDGGLLIKADGFNSEALFRAHAGHKIRQPVILKDGEMQEVFDELGILEKYAE